MSEKILDRVKKLLLKAESAKEIGSLAEAEAFMQKVNELMMEYNISMHELRKHAAKENDEHANFLYGESVPYNENQAGARWKMDLIKMLCRHNLTGVIFTLQKKTFRVYGDIQNVESTVWQFNFLSTRLLNMAKASRAALDPSTRDLYCRHTYLKNYLAGAIRGIEDKLIEQMEESKLKDAINSLVITNRQVLNRYINKMEPFTTVKPTIARNLGMGYEKGYKEGNGMSFGARLAAQQSVEKKMLR